MVHLLSAEYTFHGWVSRWAGSAACWMRTGPALYTRPCSHTPFSCDTPVASGNTCSEKLTPAQVCRCAGVQVTASSQRHIRMCMSARGGREWEHRPTFVPSSARAWNDAQLHLVTRSDSDLVKSEPPPTTHHPPPITHHHTTDDRWMSRTQPTTHPPNKSHGPLTESRQPVDGQRLICVELH
jgi:hypothetical protein